MISPGWGLYRQIHTLNDFWRVMFTPMAQGTIRPLSERGFFMLFHSLFGMDALPYRIWVFLTQFGNLALLASVTWRITRSRAAGFLAAVLWMVNSALAVGMSWTSSYNQILCAFFLLLAFRLFLEYVETGKRKYYFAQWVVFLVGFGVLELNVVYPALAFSYALFCARKYLLQTVPLFVASALFAVIHSKVAPGQKTGAYAMHWDSSILTTFAAYFRYALGPERVQTFGHGPEPWVLTTGTWILVSGVVGFAIWKLYRQEWLAAFCVGWYVIVLSPLLPLRDHFTDYYNTVPSIGLAMLGGWGLVEAWKSGMAARLVAVLLAGIYVTSNAATGRAEAQWISDRSRQLRNLVRGVERAHELHPRKIILLKNVPNEVFWTGFIDNPFPLVGVPDVYLTPESEQTIEAHPETGELREFILPEAATLLALKQGNAVVYDASGERLTNITGLYFKIAMSSWKPGLPKVVNAGEALFSNQFLTGWYPIENGYRWMPREATMRLGGPKAAGEKLYVSGYAPPEVFRDGPVHLTVSADGEKLSTVTLEPKDTEFYFTVPMPGHTVGTPETVIKLSSDRICTLPADGRELSLAFGKFRIQ